MDYTDSISNAEDNALRLLRLTYRIQQGREQRGPDYRQSLVEFTRLMQEVDRPSNAVTAKTLCQIALVLLGVIAEHNQTSVPEELNEIEEGIRMLRSR